MVDLVHLTNLIQGEVIRIKERRPLEQQYGALTALEEFLREQAQSVLIEKIRVKDQLPKPDDQTANESAVEEH